MIQCDIMTNTDSTNILEEHFIPSGIGSEEEAIEFVEGEVPIFFGDDSFEFVPLDEYAYLISDPWVYEELKSLEEVLAEI